MLKNYIKIAFRNLWKHKVDSAISIGGLAVGLACCILLVAFVHFEWSFDTFHEKSDRIYRVIEGGGAYTPVALPSTLANEFPDIEHAIKLAQGPVQLQVNDQYQADRALMASRGFFRIFSFSLLQGSAETALSEPNYIVLTEAKAEEMFGTVNVLGETVNIALENQELSFQVTAIAENPPSNSSLDFEMVIPFESLPDVSSAGSDRMTVSSGMGESWLLLREGVSAKQLEEKFPFFADEYYDEGSAVVRLALQPLDDVYFNQDVVSIFAQSNRAYSLILVGIAVVVLIIACINFVSLALGRSDTRGHEIGIRKVVGAGRRQLANQFLGEVFVTCGIAFLFAFILAEMLLPFFQQLVQKPVSLGIIDDPVLAVLLLGTFLIATLLAGGYPALVLSGKKVAATFHSHTTSGKTSPFVKGLIVVQFVIASAFIAVTFLMQQQMQYLLTKDLGYNPRNVIAVEAGGVQNSVRGTEIYRTVSDMARELPGVQSVTGSSSIFQNLEYMEGFTALFLGIRTSQAQLRAVAETADEYYLETMGIELLAGRNFSPNRPTDLSEGIIVNQRFVDEMGWNDPVGQMIEDQFGGLLDGKRVMGVMEDVNEKSLHHQIEPMVLMYRSTGDVASFSGVRSMLVRLEEDNQGETLNRLRQLWSDVLPTETFSYTFLDDYLSGHYVEEERFNTIIRASSTLSILLACFGLFGLAALAAQRRTKEIGIRKVMGATVANIIVLLNRDFLKLVVVGFVLAIPIALYAMNRWLEDFAYRIEIGPGVFLLAGSAAILIALATVSWQSVRAAVANPVEAIRSE